MRKRVKNYLLYLLTGLMVLMSSMTVSAEGTANYCFGSGGAYRSAPVSYEVEKVYHAGDIEGVENLDNLASMFVTDDSVYISTANAILVLDYDFKVKHILSEYTNLDNGTDTITNPEGIFVTDEGLLYICEPDKSRVLVFDANYKLLNNFGVPEGVDLAVAYKPSQIIVDSLDRMYIIATNVYEGILEVSSDNKFQRYFGTTTVSISPLDVFFRMIASEAQLSRQALVLPTEYTAMTVNEKGFIYTTIRTANVDNPIRLLNVNGDDIMPENWEGDEPQGDVAFATSGTTTGPSSLSYIDCNEYGMYMVLDSGRSRIFTYDKSSNVLFVFGGSGDKDGCFRNPTSIRWLGDSSKVLVADRLSKSITVMRPTRYAEAIINAVKLEEEGDRTTAVEYWRQALSMNNNCNVAKDAIGRELYWEGKYKESQEMLKSIYRTDYYSMAFEKTREELVRAYAPTAVVVLVVLIVAIKVLRRVLSRRKGGNGYAKG